LDQAIHNGCYDFNKIEFLAAIGKIQKQAFKKTSVIHAWCECGLVPYNPEIVLQKICEKESEPVSQPPTIPSQPTTSRTPWSLQKAVADFLECSQVFYQPDILDKYMLFFKGADFQAVSGAQAKENLKHSQAAELACRTRSKRKITRVQKRGVLRAADYKAIEYKKELLLQRKLLKRLWIISDENEQK